MPSQKNGDAAVVINCLAFQEPAPSGSAKAMALSNFRDGHHLVVVPMKVKACRSLTPPQLPTGNHAPPRQQPAQSIAERLVSPLEYQSTSSANECISRECVAQFGLRLRMHMTAMPTTAIVCIFTISQAVRMSTHRSQPVLYCLVP